jgi:hypothetical protein
MPRSRAAARSIDAFAEPVEAISRKRGRRSTIARVSGVRSRITQTISKGASRATTASGSAR